MPYLRSLMRNWKFRNERFFFKNRLGDISSKESTIFFVHLDMRFVFLYF